MTDGGSKALLSDLLACRSGEGVEEYENLCEPLMVQLRTAGISTAEDLLKHTSTQLVAMTDVHLHVVDRLVDQVLRALLPPMCSGLDLHLEAREGGTSIATGLSTIDQAMQGGFPAGMITELVGPSGIGKTQVCLTAAVACCMPHEMGGMGEDAGIIYIDIERKFSSERLVDIATHRWPTYYGIGEEANLERLLGLVTVYSDIQSQAELRDTMRALRPLVQDGRKRLIVLDSVAALASMASRGGMAVDGSGGGGGSGSVSGMGSVGVLVDLAAELKLLAGTHKAVVLVTNQVISASRGGGVEGMFRGEEGSADPSDTSGSISNEGAAQSKVRAALGSTWHHCVSNRLVLQQLSCTREMKITKSPMAPERKCYYEIQQEGLHEVRGKE